MINKEKFHELVTENINNLPSISANDVQGKYDLIQEIMKEIDDTKCHLSELEMKLRHSTEEYNAALAMSLRKRLPGLSVGLSNGRCSANYRSTNLSCWPDLQAQMWKFEPNRHGRSFMRRNGHLLPLGNQLEPLVDAIVNYFGRYKTLNV